jgi:DNA-binding MarR family transcriptional regulator
MITDDFDEARDQWARERPDLDPSGVEVIWRISFLHKYFKKLTGTKLGEYDLPVWAFDVLAALRRGGSPFRETPTALCEATQLTSGAMTNRLDRVEEAGLVERLQDPGDRRVVLVQLTTKGKELVDKAAKVRFDQANEAISSLSIEERRQLAGLLRKLVVDHTSK